MIGIKNSSLVCVQNGISLFLLAEKIQGGTPLTFLSKTLSGETLCKCYPIFPPKDLYDYQTIFLVQHDFAASLSVVCLIMSSPLYLGVHLTFFVFARFNYNSWKCFVLFFNIFLHPNSLLLSFFKCDSQKKLAWKHTSKRPTFHDVRR